jgi:hypothetical protein
MEMKKPQNVPNNRTTFYHDGIGKVALGKAIGTARHEGKGYVIVEWQDPDVADEEPCEALIPVHNVLEILAL